MKKITGRGMKVLKILHLLLAFMWIGGAFSMMLLFLTTSPQDSHELYMRSLALQLIDDWLIIPGAVGMLISGIVYGVWTNWGFFKYRWIIVKWILTVVMILVGTFLMGPCVNGNVYPVEDISKYTLDNSVFFRNVSTTIFWGLIQTFMLLFVVAISVLKPWKLRKNS